MKANYLVLCKETVAVCSEIRPRHIKACVITGFLLGVSGVDAVLGCYVASICSD